MNVIGEKLRKAAVKNGNNGIVNAVDKAARADKQRKESKANAKTNGKQQPAKKAAAQAKAGKEKVVKTLAEAVVDSKGEFEKAIKKGLEEGINKLTPEQKQKAFFPKVTAKDFKAKPQQKTKLGDEAFKARRKQLEKPKDTLTNKGVQKLNAGAKQKPQQKKPHAKPAPQARVTSVKETQGRAKDTHNVTAHVEVKIPVKDIVQAQPKRKPAPKPAAKEQQPQALQTTESLKSFVNTAKQSILKGSNLA